MAKLNIVGVGPGSPDYVTPAARKAVQQADLVIGAKRSLNMLQGDIKGETLTLTAQNLEEALQYAADSTRNGKTVALLSTGDPGFSGLLGSVLSRNLGRNVEVHVVAGVSAVQACAARLGMRWDQAVLFTFHDGATPEMKEELAAAVKAGKEVLLLPEPKAFAPNHIAGFLLDSGVDKKTPVLVCENVTLESEKVTETTLQEALGLSFGSLCVMVIKNEEKQKRVE